MRYCGWAALFLALPLAPCPSRIGFSLIECQTAGGRVQPLSCSRPAVGGRVGWEGAHLASPCLVPGCLLGLLGQVRRTLLWGRRLGASRGPWGGSRSLSGSWVPSLRASHLRQVPQEPKRRQTELRSSLSSLPTSVVGGAGVRKGELQPARRVRRRGVWVVLGQWPVCVQMSPFQSQKHVPLSGGGVGVGWSRQVGNCEGHLEGVWWARGSGPALVHKDPPVSTCGLEAGPGVQEPQFPHPAVRAVPISAGANRIPGRLRRLPTPLPWHSWGLSQCPNQECC